MKAKITKDCVNKTKPEKRDVFIWDTEVSGFGLKVTPAGKRVYVLQYRFGNRKSPWRYTIANHGDMTPDQARNEAVRLRGLIVNGVNPAQDKSAKRAAMSVSELAGIFMEEHVRARRKDRTVTEYIKIFDRIVNPKIGSLSVADVTRADIARLHHKLGPTPTQANRVVAVLSKMFNWAELKGHRADNSNPCRHIERYAEKKRDRYLSEAEINSLANALRKVEFEGSASPQAVAAIRLLLLTGARLNEILTLRWEYVDFDNACLRLPDSKTGAKTIHLNPPAMEVIQSLVPIEGNPFVIPGHRTGQHMVNLGKPWRRVRVQAGLDNVRLHDLRHSFASLGAGAGLTLPMIGALLGHSQPATTQRYAHFATDPLKQASDLIGSRIGAAMTGEAAEVVELPGRKP